MIYIAIFIFGFSLDLITKNMANEKLTMHLPVKIGGPLYLVLVHNKGAAFGFLRNRQSLLMVLSTVAVFLLIGIFIAALFLNYGVMFLISLMTIITGAVGNYTERAIRGKVTDFIFIKYKYLPVFNLADLYIFFGTAMIFISSSY